MGQLSLTKKITLFTIFHSSCFVELHKMSTMEIGTETLAVFFFGEEKFVDATNVYSDTRVGR